MTVISLFKLIFYTASIFLLCSYFCVFALLSSLPLLHFHHHFVFFALLPLYPRVSTYHFYSYTFTIILCFCTVNLISSCTYLYILSILMCPLTDVRVCLCVAVCVCLGVLCVWSFDCSRNWALACGCLWNNKQINK